MATTLSECSPTPVDELGRYQNPDHDETQRSLSAEDLLYRRDLSVVSVSVSLPE